MNLEGIYKLNDKNLRLKLEHLIIRRFDYCHIRTNG